MLSVYPVLYYDILARTVLVFSETMKSHCPSETQIQRDPIERRRSSRLNERMKALRTAVERFFLESGAERRTFSCFLGGRAYSLCYSPRFFSSN